MASSLAGQLKRKKMILNPNHEATRHLMPLHLFELLFGVMLWRTLQAVASVHTAGGLGWPFGRSMALDSLQDTEK